MIEAEQLPNDIAALKQIVQTLQQQNVAQQQRITTLEELVMLLRGKQFGPSSEQGVPDQMGLFSEAEVTLQGVDIQALEQAEQAIAQGQPAAPSKKGKRGRRPLPPDLPRVRVEHDLAEADKFCPCCEGHPPLHRIGEDISEQLDIIPAQVRVVQHVRPRYGCRGCEGHVAQASMPAQLLPKSLATPGLLAQIAVNKYEHGLPLYRQENILQRIGVDIPRATSANWMVKTGLATRPLINLMREVLLSSSLIHMDETTVQVLKEKGRSAQSTSYMWVQVCAGATPVRLFHYAPTRSGTVPKTLLDGFTGHLQTDGYEGYNTVRELGGILQQGCWAHARRKFFDALKGQAKPPDDRTSVAQQGFDYIQGLYRIERAIDKDAPPDERQRHRLAHSQPLLGEMRQWLEDALPQVPPKSLTGSALGYLHNQWEKLVRVLDAGYLRLDNNLAENAIRPFVIGRKAWLFCTSVKGAEASANIYSLIETAKANHLDAYDYLYKVFTDLPKAQTVADIEALLPWNIKPT